jgi:CheY-like chemotaxis protein
VLVVDDEPTLRLGFAYALSDHQVDTAATGREALVKLDQQTYDIVILDLRMPDIDGLGVIETLRRRGHLVPIVLCSAGITPSSALRAITGQVVDFLLKPVRPADLRDVIEHVLSPSTDEFSLGLAAARGGRFEDAVKHLERALDTDGRVHGWLGVLRAIRSGSLEGEAIAFGKLERDGLSVLAFRSSRA